MHGLLSNTVYKIESSELLRRGFLVPTRVAFVPIPAKPKLRGVDNNFVTGHGKFGIHEHRIRNELVVEAVRLLYEAGRKVLVLVGTKAQGYAIQKRALHFISGNSRAQFKSVEFVSTDVPRPVQNKILDSYLNDQEVKVLVGTSLLGEGVDLPNVDALVYARGEKAEVTLSQSAYRVCTAVSGKSDAVIVDFADRHHRKLLQHSRERLHTYYHEPTFHVTVLPGANHLEHWVQEAA
jgi:superfamily II DNA or RNA helicase